MNEPSKKPDVFKDHDCVTGSLVGASASGSTLKVIPMFCHKWTCPRCSKRKASVWRSIAQRGKPERFITLTLKADENKDVIQYAKEGKKAFAKLVQKLRRRYEVFEYMLVWELTKKGTPHIHMLQRGTWIPKQVLSDLWCSLTGSFIVDIKRIHRSNEVARYITKYMGKSIAECSEVLNGLRMLQKSKNYVIEPLPEEERGGDEDIEDIDSWIFCSATPRELLEVAKELFGCTLDDRSSANCLVLRAPPDPDLACKLVHHFDDDRSYS